MGMESMIKPGIVLSHLEYLLYFLPTSDSHKILVSKHYSRQQYVQDLECTVCCHKSRVSYYHKVLASLNFQFKAFCLSNLINILTNSSAET